MLNKEFEALKRIRQETAPATYMPDFDKGECCDIIEQALQRLDKYEEILSEGRLIQDEIYEEYNTDDMNCYGVKRIRNNATIKLGKLEDIYEEDK